MSPTHSLLYGEVVKTPDLESVGLGFKYRNFCPWKEKPSLISLILNTKSEKHDYLSFLFGYASHRFPINLCHGCPYKVRDAIIHCIFTARKRSLGTLCFYTCLSFCPQGGICPIAYWDTHTPRPEADTPPDQRQVHPPWDQRQVSPRTRDRYQPPPQGRTHPRSAVHAGRYRQQAGGTHPTGMQSCTNCYSTLDFSLFSATVIELVVYLNLDNIVV